MNNGPFQPAATSQEQKLLLARLADKEREVTSRSTPAFLGFLTPAEQALLSPALPRLGCRAEFFGGYEQAQRRLLVLLPDWCDAPRAFDGFVSLLRITSSAFDPSLGHRDYLGSLLGCGVRREALGDLLIRSDAKRRLCDAFIVASAAPGIENSLLRVGRSAVTVQTVPVQSVDPPPEQTEQITDTVPAPRLDAVLAAGFALSRAKAKELVLSGVVNLNYLPESRPEREVAAGDVISARGHGKLRVASFDGQTKKGRLRVTVEKFV